MRRAARNLIRRIPSLEVVLLGIRRDLVFLRARPRWYEGQRIRGADALIDADFEPEIRAWLRTSANQFDIFVDVGANVGIYTLLARMVGLHVVAVEPVPHNMRLLLDNLGRNGWADVECWPVAVGGRTGLVELYGEGTGASIVNGWAGSDTRQSSILVPMTTLDNLLGRFTSERLAIKIDAEGAELDVLDGAGAVLHRNPAPVWVVEIDLGKYRPDGSSSVARAVFDRFDRAGYVCTGRACAGVIDPPTFDDIVKRSRSEDVANGFFFAKPDDGPIHRPSM